MEITKWGRFTHTEPTIYVLWKRFRQLVCFWLPKFRYDSYWLQCGNPDCAADNIVNVPDFPNTISRRYEATCPKCGVLNKQQ